MALFFQNDRIMKLKSFLKALFVVCLLAVPVSMNSQAEIIEANCKANFEYPFILTGRPFRALITNDEVAEFRATLFSGTTYRISAGSQGNSYLIFSVYDTDHNLLFTNKDHGNATYWDFEVDGYLDCIVEARLDESITSSGFAILMTGIKLNE